MPRRRQGWGQVDRDKSAQCGRHRRPLGSDPPEFEVMQSGIESERERGRVRRDQSEGLLVENDLDVDVVQRVRVLPDEIEESRGDRDQLELFGGIDRARQIVNREPRVAARIPRTERPNVTIIKTSRPRPSGRRCKAVSLVLATSWNC